MTMSDTLLGMKHSLEWFWEGLWWLEVYNFFGNNEDFGRLCCGRGPSVYGN